MHSKTQITKRFAALAALLAVSAVAVPGSAVTFAQDHGSNCLDILPDSNFFYRLGANQATANTLILSCPTEDSTTLTHQSVTALGIYYEDQNSSFSLAAAACVDYENATGGACGTFTGPSGSTTGVGVFAVTSFTAWNTASHFAYVSVQVPPKVGSNASSIKGYTYSK